MSDLETKVHEAFDNAYSGGWVGFLRDTSPRKIALDLIDKCEPLNNETWFNILPHVNSWLAKNKERF